MEKVVVHNVKKNVVAKNVTANFILRIWLTLANFIFVPFYIRFLGRETYGLITFFATLQTIINVVAVGLSKSLRREFASSNESGCSAEEKYKLFRSVELIFVGFSLVIIIASFFGRGLICDLALNVEELNISTVELAVFLMVISISLQLIASMLQGCLFGLEKQVEADLIQFSWSFLKNVGVILLLWLFKIDIIWFFLWYIALDFLYLIVLRIRVVHYSNPIVQQQNVKENYAKNKFAQLLLRIIPKRSFKWRFSDMKKVGRVLPYAFSLLFMSLCSIAVDKLIISSSFSLTTSGAYNTVSNLGNFVLIVSTSVGIALFSRFAFLKSENRIEESKALFFKTNKRVNIVVICLGVFLAFFVKELILAWTSDSEITNIISKTGFFVVLALAFNGAQQMSYEYLLSNGVVWLDNVRSFLTLAFLLIFEPIAIKFFGFENGKVGVFEVHGSDSVSFGRITIIIIPFFWILSILFAKKPRENGFSCDKIEICLLNSIGGYDKIKFGMI